MLQHEFGHNLGLMHSGLMIARVIPAFRQACWDPGLVQPVCGLTTVMSTGFGHDSAIDKAKIEWISPDQIRDANASGGYVLDQVELESSGSKVIRISAGTEKTAQSFTTG